MIKEYIIKRVKTSMNKKKKSETIYVKRGTLNELKEFFYYTLITASHYAQENDNYEINKNPKSIEELLDTLNKCAYNLGRPFEGYQLSSK